MSQALLPICLNICMHMIGRRLGPFPLKQIHACDLQAGGALSADSAPTKGLGHTHGDSLPIPLPAGLHTPLPPPPATIPATPTGEPITPEPGVPGMEDAEPAPPGFTPPGSPRHGTDAGPPAAPPLDARDATPTDVPPPPPAPAEAVGVPSGAEAYAGYVGPDGAAYGYPGADVYGQVWGFSTRCLHDRITANFLLQLYRRSNGRSFFRQCQCSCGSRVLSNRLYGHCSTQRGCLLLLTINFLRQSVRVWRMVPPTGIHAAKLRERSLSGP